MSTVFSPHIARTSTPNDEDRPSYMKFSAASEDWPCFKCIPTNKSPPNQETGGGFLQRLEETLDGQFNWQLPNYDAISSEDSLLYVEPVTDGVRDRLMVTAQSFLAHARSIHRKVADSRAKTGTSSGFVILPPPSVLDSFLRAYAVKVEKYMPFFSGGVISSSNIVGQNPGNPAILLLLLMIAHGAMGSPTLEAHHFANGVIETCRLCLLDMLEKNVQLATHPMMLRCALLYLNAALWSGNRWHMSVSSDQESCLSLFTDVVDSSLSLIISCTHSSPTAHVCLTLAHSQFLKM